MPALAPPVPAPPAWGAPNPPELTLEPATSFDSKSIAVRPPQRASTQSAAPNGSHQVARLIVNQLIAAPSREQDSVCLASVSSY
jgi:hypothetical protein